jgi:uncharacterized cupin superfamily protein
MSQIIHRQANAEEKEQCQNWELWESGNTNRFEYSYNQDVHFVVQQGEAVIHSATNTPVSISPGSHVTICKGVVGVWEINSPIINRYQYL